MEHMNEIYTLMVKKTVRFGPTYFSHNNTGNLFTCIELASSCRLFCVGGEKRAWYTLFVHD